jgi:hypothetical protein
MGISRVAASLQHADAISDDKAIRCRYQLSDVPNAPKRYLLFLLFPKLGRQYKNILTSHNEHTDNDDNHDYSRMRILQA